MMRRNNNPIPRHITEFINTLPPQERQGYLEFVRRMYRLPPRLRSEIVRIVVQPMRDEARRARERRIEIRRHQRQHQDIIDWFLEHDPVVEEWLTSDEEEEPRQPTRGQHRRRDDDSDSENERPRQRQRVENIPSMKKGGYVKKDGLHYLHKGEYVMSKKEVNKSKSCSCKK